MRIYTRTGDDGTTGLLYGGRVAKDSELPTAYGDVDELQAVLGLVRSAAGASGDEAGDDLASIVLGVQRDLWVLMAEVATAPENRAKLTPGSTSVTEAMVEHLEERIDEVSERFEMPTEFVVPGGTETAARLDVARTVARRAERSVITAGMAGTLVSTYLNRLSDLLWTLARWREGESLGVRSVAPSPEGPDA